MSETIHYAGFKNAINGTCCQCGYKEPEETECPVREDKQHCEHWYDGPDCESSSAHYVGFKNAINGTCCQCGYKEPEETECSVRENKQHCEHWYNGPYWETGLPVDGPTGVTVSSNDGTVNPLDVTSVGPPPDHFAGDVTGSSVPFEQTVTPVGSTSAYESIAKGLTELLVILNRIADSLDKMAGPTR